MPEGTGMAGSDTAPTLAGEAGVGGRKKIQVIVPEELDQRLDRAATMAGTTKSELIRQILIATIADVEASL